MGRKNVELGAVEVSREKKRVKKKRAASDLDLTTAATTENTKAIDELHVDDDLNEPTMGEKLASLNLLDDDKSKSPDKDESSPGTKPPSADSIHILLKQALHADDRVLLLDCLYTQDEKVIANSVFLLNPSDVLKLLDCLVSMIQSRGAILACAIPWLRSLLLQHSSGIISQESSLLALNSLYQLIESRVSTFRPTLQLSSCMDYLFAGIADEVDDEMNTMTPIIFEDKDSDEDEVESEEDAMDSDQENEEEQQEEIINGGFSDFDDSADDMSD